MIYSDRFEKLFEHLIEDEGGYLPQRQAVKIGDSGGATKYGISLSFLQSVGVKEFDFNNDGKIDGKDIIILNKNQAKEIYYRYFYSPLYEKIFDIQLANRCFNFGVNAGKKRAVKLLQICVNKLLRTKLLKEDGVFGIKTLAAVNNVSKELLYDYYVKAIEVFYKQLDKPHFLKGWLNRLYRKLKDYGSSLEVLRLKDK